MSNRGLLFKPVGQSWAVSQHFSNTAILESDDASVYIRMISVKLFIALDIMAVLPCLETLLRPED